MTLKNTTSHISLHSIYPNGSSHFLGKHLLNFADKIMGLKKLNSIYSNSHLPGLAANTFCKELLALLKTPLMGTKDLHVNLPDTGPTIIVANHPFGCLEGVALAHEVRKIRPDVKVLANRALSMFKELEELFIFIDPLRPNDPKNITALKQCKMHLKQGGVLIIFPSGKVSEYYFLKRRICDDSWNRVAAQLAKSCEASVLPIFFDGHNSKMFIRLAMVWSKLKLLMLFREVLKRRGTPIKMQVGQLLTPKQLAKLKNVNTINDYLRVQTYALNPQYSYEWPDDQIDTLQPLALKLPRERIKTELAHLPAEQCLVKYKGFSVYYSYQQQTPSIVEDIARERERVFRLHNEGSGNPIDTDAYDASYVHLYIVEDESLNIIGAYRMGQTDVLLKEGGLKSLYLSKMFNFKKEFINQREPCLEMGRSFIVPEHQRSFYGLYLLWRGIGEYVVRHPHYRTLYGTVSISKLYSPISVECMRQLALRPSVKVEAKWPFNVPNNPELSEFIAKHREQNVILSALVQGIERDKKDVPVLMKQYQKMAARFYCIGIDQNFNDTPGMLLSVHLPSAPQKSLKQYLANGLDSYLAFKNDQ
ncbi:lysophospholipid acyltransferase family protein [Psychrosphaera aestuarii]|uniref:lysophospholipid acyltransferase family protein n=1 Tax=Psychrosphaera aestuarii TaxID=1266052 RepID=UPI001B3240F1|nr:GNAT family N-acyltransferase [Psychrosphaera aestuarii]